MTDQVGDGVADEFIEGLDIIIEDEMPGHVGLAMSPNLYLECMRRKLISMETSSGLEASFQLQLPAYRGRHFAFVHPGLDDWQFQVEFRLRV